MNSAFELFISFELNVSLNISRKTLAFVLNFLLLLLLTLVYQFFINQKRENKIKETGEIPFLSRVVLDLIEKKDVGN